MTEPVKTCTRCRESKPLDRFHRRAVARDGRNASCKACENRRNSSAARHTPRVVPPVTPDRARERVEQGIARGDTPARIAATVGCPVELVHAIMRRMDREHAAELAGTRPGPAGVARSRYPVAPETASRPLPLVPARGALLTAIRIPLRKATP